MTMAERYAEKSWTRVLQGSSEELGPKATAIADRWLTATAALTDFVEILLWDLQRQRLSSMAHVDQHEASQPRLDGEPHSGLLRRKTLAAHLSCTAGGPVEANQLGEAHPLEQLAIMSMLFLSSF